jgi:hypothetical protein
MLVDKLVGAKVVEQDITMEAKEYSTGIIKSELVDCNIRIPEPYTIGFYCSQFTRCRFEFGKLVREHHFDACQFIECTFSGRFQGCIFGMEQSFVPAGESPCAFKPMLRSCDFSRAKLDGCMFLNLDIETTVFPPWPHIILLNPVQNAADWRAIPFPPSFAIAQKMDYDPRVVAITFNWHLFAKSAGEPLELPDELRKTLESKTYIRM